MKRLQELFTRLWVRLVLLVVLGLIATVGITLFLQYYFISVRYKQIDSPFLQKFEQIARESDLPRPELEAELNKLFRTEFEPNAFIDFLMVIFTSPQDSLFLTTAIILPIGILLALLLAWYFVQPIRQVVASSRQVAKGDLSVRAGYDKGMMKSAEITELIDNFNIMTESLQRLEHERQAMIADIAHELRTPLTIIQGQIDAMDQGVASLDKTNLRTLSKQTQLLTRLVKDLRTLSLAEAGRLVIEKQSVDVVTLAQDLVESFRDQAEEKNIALEFSSEKVPKLELDPERTAQVIINLLSNALNHTPSGGRISVAVKTVLNNVEITVVDTGTGLSEQALLHVFDRFYRGEGAGGESTGLGLAIAKALVSLQHGRLEVRNQPTGGALFRIVFSLTLVGNK